METKHHNVFCTSTAHLEKYLWWHMKTVLQIGVFKSKSGLIGEKTQVSYVLALCENPNISFQYC